MAGDQRRRGARPRPARRDSRRCRRSSITGWVLVVRSSCFLRAFADQAADVLAQRAEASSSVCAHGRRGRPRRRACRPPASPGRERRKRRLHVMSSGRRAADTGVKVSRTAPQVKPPPTPSSITVSPRLIVPARTASSRASGIEAADVLPCSVDGHDQLVAAASFSFFAVLCMMRMLAWCGISQSMSASLWPALASTARADALEHARPRA